MMRPGLSLPGQGKPSGAVGMGMGMGWKSPAKPPGLEELQEQSSAAARVVRMSGVFMWVCGVFDGVRGEGLEPRVILFLAGCGHRVTHGGELFCFGRDSWFDRTGGCPNCRGLVNSAISNCSYNFKLRCMKRDEAVCGR
jgi:hypothetical protein